MSQDIDNIVHDFQQARQNNDYSHVTWSVHQLQVKDGMNWQKDATAINAKLKDLGFNDFSIVGTDQQGHLITRSADGKKVETRDPIHAKVETMQDNKDTAQKWGKREFQVNPDGSAHYQAKAGDRYWDVVKDALTENLGHNPTNTEIANSLVALAKSQGRDVKDLNKLMPNDQIDIPMPTPKGDGTYQRQPTAPISDTHDKTNPLNLPGADTSTQNPDRTRTVNQRDPEGGFLTSKSTGELNDNTLPTWLGGHGTKFDSTELKDQNGHLLTRTINYQGNGRQMTVTDENGKPQVIDGVSTVQTKFNDYSGRYETQITTKDGHSYNVLNKSNGETMAFNPKPSDA